ncbi:Galactosylceramide sulfotransferase-like 1 [Homarus americanus]|uniref:Galactosylceramide sulfotransferase-like 1 n=1 Tax=Homarus americanus TaxID=6706 RepID=A0A8J5MVS1_HOMAM|nr:Galactosylceramide sulfotransferase-like 1 [Homarus americanus]
MVNILFRYGLSHDLRFAFPHPKVNYFGDGRIPFHADMLKATPWSNNITINIFAIHTKWNHQQVQQVMPRDTIFFTIVREPVEQFISLFTYYELQKVQMADKQFHLVMVADRMEESLVLLSHLLCWDLQHLLVLKLNGCSDSVVVYVPISSATCHYYVEDELLFIKYLRERQFMEVYHSGYHQ